MTTHAAISVLGKDRPGIVAAISKELFQTGCNIEDSSMTSLRSEFAMILLVALPSKTTVRMLDGRLSAVAKRMGLSVSLRTLSKDENRPGGRAGKPFVLSVYGADKPGIVSTVTDFLAQHRVNITDVQTRIVGRGKASLYVMLLEVSLPRGASPNTIITKLSKLAASLKVTVTLNPVDTPEM